MRVRPVILCGGSGTRLWPLSRGLYPKQFQTLAGDESLLQATLRRAAAATGGCQPIVVASEEHRFIVHEQAHAAGVDPEAIILEPASRNTAPAVALAALLSTQNAAEDILLALPSDHLVRNEDAFNHAVASGIKAARAGMLVTFGITPNAPSPAYGYIKAGPAWRDDPCTGIHIISQFREKPDEATAARYVKEGDYFWNSGMFMFQARTILEEMSRVCPEVESACRRSMYARTNDGQFTRPHERDFVNCPSISIDHAVMEHAENAVVLPVEFGWSDVGTWKGYWEAQAKDDNGNVVRGRALVRDTSGSLLRTDGRLVVSIGVHDLVVVDTDDVTLVAHKDRSEDVKSVVESLKGEGREEAESHLDVFRPWGSYRRMGDSGHYQVKLLRLKPGARISLQLHHRRSEHWVVVRGTAKVVRGDESLILVKDESTFIPVGTRHQLENPGDEPLEIIEVQTGDYFGEDDIVRFEDDYGRV